MLSDSGSSQGSVARSLRSRGPPESDSNDTPTISQSRKRAAHWTKEEETALLKFLSDNLSAAGDGGFKSKTFSSAASYLKHKFPTYKGAEKTTSVCKTKWTSVSCYLLSYVAHDRALTSIFTVIQLKGSYNAVVEIKRASGFTWSDERGADIDLQHGDAWAKFAKVSCMLCSTAVQR
jgi:hypothetical protein